MSKLKKVGSVLLSILLWIIIIVAVIFVFVTLSTKDPNNLSSIGGVTPLSVQTDSMSPTFNSGDLILIKKVDPNTLQVGDIVTYHTIIENQYALNSHRIVEIFDRGSYKEFMTKGDNNPVEDSTLIMESDIAGKHITTIPKLGAVMDFLQGKVGFFVVILLPLLAFFIYQVYHLIVVATEYKKADAIETAMAVEEAKKNALQQLESSDGPSDDHKPESPPGAQTGEDEVEKMREEAARMLEEAKRAQEEAAARLEAVKAMEEEKKDKLS